ncbi:MAG TPA: hypothetical protein VND94_21145 [Terriglobia bacterium]|nr:hypothetical protein [Terriglobia bacterium]
MRIFVIQMYQDGQPDGPPIREVEATTAAAAIRRVSAEDLTEKGPLRLIRAEVWPQDNPKQRWRFFLRN